MCGKYIVIEGLDGSGKTTVKNIVYEVLYEYGIQEIIFTREPGSTQLGEKLRNLVLNIKSLDNEIINHKAELLIFYAARVQLIENIIKPSLAKGCWVIGDRHDLSTYAYQGGGRGINLNILTILRKVILENFYPDLTLYLDVTPEIGLRRSRSSGTSDRIEQELLDFFNRTRSYYLKLAKKDNNIYIIDANQTLKEVANVVRKTIIKWLQEHKI